MTNIRTIQRRMGEHFAFADSTPEPGKYNPEAVNKEINKDKRIGGKEAKAIHRLLKGRTKADGDGDWNIKQLYDALKKDLTQCHTGSEKAMCKAIGGKEIRETAESIAKSRKLTPGEIAIAQEFGYRG